MALTDKEFASKSEFLKPNLNKNFRAGRTSGLYIQGIQDWGDVANINAYEIMYADAKKVSSKTDDYMDFETAMYDAQEKAIEEAPEDTGLLKSSIRGKYGVGSFDRLEFKLLVGGEGGVKDYYNSAFQKTLPNTYMRRANAVDNATTRLNIYPAIQEQKHHYLERGMEENIGKIEQAFLRAYDIVIDEKKIKGK